MTSRTCQRGGRGRAGLTLIELLVVLAIIAILIGLMASGVQKVRDAAARIRCQNQLKQISLALHHCEETEGSLPLGYRLLPLSVPRTLTGWTLDVLPYLEQQPLSDQSAAAFRTSPWAFNNPPHVGFSTVVPAFLCPSDSRVLSPKVSARTGHLAAFTSYLGISGRDYSTADGVLHQKGPQRLSDVTDGTSQTLIVGERPPSADYQYGWWYAGTGQALTGSGDIILGVEEQNITPITEGSDCGPGRYRYQPGRFSDPCAWLHFWSPHSGGANFAFCDGSVRFLRYSASPIMPQLASRAGGEVVEVP